MFYNIYCDESCHLEHDGINVMALGGIWCLQEKICAINTRIKEIKSKYNIRANNEVKWTKISPSKYAMYEDIINYFFDDNDLCYRGVIVPDKAKLDHSKYNQTHDIWYYKMYFTMLKQIFTSTDKYNIYIDVKDTNSCVRVQKLHQVCCNNIYDFSASIIQKIQVIRSEEVQIMQLVDILTGALTFANRYSLDNEHRSKAKSDIVSLIKKRSHCTLSQTTLPGEKKFNLLVWKANYYDREQ